MSEFGTRRDLYRARKAIQARKYINPAQVWNRLQEMGRSVPWLAEQLGVRPSTVHNWLGGRARVPHVQAGQLAETLRLPTTTLLSQQKPRPVPAASRGESRALPYANSERIRAEMDRRGWSASELARRAGIGRTTVRSILAETKRVGPEIQVKLSQALDLAREDVVDLEPVDPVFDPGRVMEEPAPYEVRQSIEGRAGTVIRPRTNPLLDEAYKLDSRANLPCGCAVYWRGPGLGSETLDLVREHYRGHVVGIMQEPGRLADTPRTGEPGSLPSPYRRGGGMVWPRLATREQAPALPKILPRRRTT